LVSRCRSRRRAALFLNHSPTTEIYTLSLHDALPIFTGGIVQKHVFTARIGSIDPIVAGSHLTVHAGGTGVPLIDRPVVLDARIGALPGGLSDLTPQLPGTDHLFDLPGRPVLQRPPPVLLKRVEKFVGDPDRVVGILTRDGIVRLPVKGGIITGLNQGADLLFLL